MEINKSDERFLKQAIELSRKKMNEGAGGPFGAVIIIEGSVISEGWNQVTSKNDPTSHAEIEAIRKACLAQQHFELKNATLYSSCEPCPMCMSAIYWARIGRVVYANTRKQAKAIDFDDDFIYDELALPNSKRKVLLQHWPLKTAADVFREWDKKKDKIRY